MPSDPMRYVEKGMTQRKKRDGGSVAYSTYGTYLTLVGCWWEPPRTLACIAVIDLEWNVTGPLLQLSYRCAANRYLHALVVMGG